MPYRRFSLFAALALILLPALAQAQGARVPFGGLSHDTAAPVEVTADELSVNQGDGTAIFTGNVVIGQGEMRLSAGSVRVEYDEGGAIARMHADGGVTLVSGDEAAESQSAVYDIEGGQVLMSGNVMLTEAGNALSGDRMVIDLTAGTARMEGRVRTILQGSGGTP
ncbi:LptA/OstA family protein [Alkalilacustris brevis]|uniref:LptA/OstA family protein n=1 Tax=Alkalilacustris brevis TaxID=2026338 RepID=UPI000E0DEF41|nr:LptA/OstA family protein [Alkalilacustris brevis]